jgi:hypothetical protein
VRLDVPTIPAVTLGYAICVPLVSLLGRAGIVPKMNIPLYGMVHLLQMRAARFAAPEVVFDFQLRHKKKILLLQFFRANMILKSAALPRQKYELLN